MDRFLLRMLVSRLWTINRGVVHNGRFLPGFGRLLCMNDDEDGCLIVSLLPRNLNG